MSTKLLGALLVCTTLPAPGAADDCGDLDCDQCFINAALLYHGCLDAGYPSTFCVGGYEAEMEECYEQGCPEGGGGGTPN